MDFDRFTEKSRSFMQKAQTLAMRRNHQSLEPEHLLRVMLDDEDGLTRKLAVAAGGDAMRLESAVDQAIAKFPEVTGGGAGLRISTDLSKILDKSLEISEKSGEM